MCPPSLVPHCLSASPEAGTFGSWLVARESWKDAGSAGPEREVSTVTPVWSWGRARVATLSQWDNRDTNAVLHSVDRSLWFCPGICVAQVWGCGK